MGRATLLIALAVCLPAAVRAGDFEVRLRFTNAHLRELFLGCNAKGSDGYDRGLDDFAPPPGIQVGYIGFVAPAKLPFLYRDIRGPEGPHTWKLYVKVFKEKPVAVSWDRAALPEGWDFTLTQGEESSDMRKVETIMVETSGTLTIVGKPRDTSAGTRDGTVPGNE